MEASNRRNSDAKFVIERQYLVPMYQHIVVEADNLEQACEKVISDDIDWDTQEMDCDGARKTALTFVKEIPAGLDETRGILWDRSENPDRPLAIAPATFLYSGDHGQLLEIPAKFTEND